MIGVRHDERIVLLDPPFAYGRQMVVRDRDGNERRVMYDETLIERQKRRDAAALERPSDAELPEGSEPGMCCCLCGTIWSRLDGFRRLADVQCPACGAGYADCGWNIEP